jgi:hypothetical protein
MAGFGALIQYDDLLKVDGTATILCGDLTLRTIEGRDSCPCPPGPDILSHEGAHYRDIPKNVPYIQHPRNTLVLDARPLLRWHDTGASDYTVSIVQGGRAIWQQDDVVGREMEYPVDAPPLQPGVDYLLVVEDNDTGVGSGADPTPGTGFQVVAAVDRAAIETHRDEILVLSSLDGPARDFALAVYYATWRPSEGGRSLWGETWLLLESVVQTYDTPAVHLWTGDALSAMKLFDEAETTYQMALGCAEDLDDLESRAAAHVELWRIAQDQNHHDRALELYQTLGDEAAIQALTD